MIDVVLFFGALAILALAYPWSVARRFAPPAVPRDTATIQAWYERRYRRTFALRVAQAVALVYFLVRGLTETRDDAPLRSVAVPTLLVFIALYLASVLGAIVWRYRLDRAFVRGHSEFAGSVQPLGVRLAGLAVLTASLALLGLAFVVREDLAKWLLIGGAFAVFLLGQRAMLAVIVRSRVFVPLDSPTGRCLAQTVERFGFTPRQIVLIPSTMANAFALPNGTVMVTTALRAITTDEELTAVVAHELSHARDRDARKIQRYRMLAALLFGTLGGALGGVLAVYERTVLFLLPTFLCAGMVLGQLVALRMARMTQRMEFKCDADTASLGLGSALADGLVKLHRYMGLPERWMGVDRLFLSHPSLEDRLARLGRTTA